jgi:hypothetical protein
MTDGSNEPRADDGRHNDAAILDLTDYRSGEGFDSAVQIVTFHRRELDAILRVYGRMVADGEWRDYAIDHLRDKAVFSVFRRASEVPLFRIEKTPKLARKQGAFSVTAASGLVVKRGQELDIVLRVFDKRPKLVRW